MNALFDKHLHRVEIMRLLWRVYMKVDISLSYPHINQQNLNRKTVIMIDALRASCTILTALHKGCKQVIPVETLGQALAYASKENVLTIGERFSEKVDGFDLNNSPAYLSTLDLRNKGTIITSSNGTKAIHKSKKSACLLIGAFMNAKHCTQTARATKRDIIINCAGRHGDFALEDGLAAGYMIHLLEQQQPSLQFTDIARFAKWQYEQNVHKLSSIVRNGATAKKLIATGQHEDIDFCLQKDIYELSGVYAGEGIVQI